MAFECMSKTNSCFSNIGLRITLHKKKSSKKPTIKSSSSSPSVSSSNSPCSSFTLRSTPINPRGRTREDELKDVFGHFDMDNDGKISALELQRYFNSIGEIMSKEEAQEVIDELDSNKDGMLEFEDFVKLMENKDGGDDDLKKVFEMFEHEKGFGRITPRGLQRALKKLGDSKSFKECKAMIQVYDVDGDGELDFNEFHHMMVA